MEGLVIRTTGSWYRVIVHDKTGDARCFDCRLRGNYRLHGSKQTNPIAVGDQVRFEIGVDGTGIISEIKDRVNCIVRRATKLSKQTHVIAANIDLLCIVATLAHPRTSTGFIDRLLATAEAYHIKACLIFNKMDLVESDNVLRQTVEIQTERYRGIGYAVYHTSAHTGQGIEALKQMITEQKVLFCGHSGVGKSALLNAMVPTLDLKEGDVSDWSQKGKHTTTFAEIHPVDLVATEEGITKKTYLIDTPGIKEFGMVDFDAYELSHCFPEMRERLHGCHFATCTHRHEPHCAIKAAVEAGEISKERYNNYLNILETLE